MRIPLQQLTGVQEFMGLEFYVNEHVLIPRQDTETLVELVLSEHKEKNISLLDVCTGSGCIAVSLAKLGGYTDVTALDLSEEALKGGKIQWGKTSGSASEIYKKRYVFCFRSRKSAMM